MSQACVRKLNREREVDTRVKLNAAYKNLLRVSINLNSRQNMASLLSDSEKQLKDILGVKNVLVLVIDHEQEMFVKLKHELLSPNIT